MQILLAILSILKSIPGLVKIAIALEKFINEYQARKRKIVKDAAVDAAIAGVLSSKNGEQSTADAKDGFPSGGQSGAGMGEGRIEDNKQS